MAYDDDSKKLAARDAQRQELMEAIKRIRGQSEETDTESVEATKEQRRINTIANIGQGVMAMLGTERSTASKPLFDSIRDNGPVGKLSQKRSLQTAKRNRYATDIASLENSLTNIDKMDGADDQRALNRENIASLKAMREYSARDDWAGKQLKLAQLINELTKSMREPPGIRKDQAAAEKIQGNITDLQNMMNGPDGKPLENPPGTGLIGQFKGAPVDFSLKGIASGALNMLGQTSDDDRKVYSLRNSLANDYALLMTGQAGSAAQYAKLYSTYGLDGSNAAQMRIGLKELAQDMETVQNALKESGAKQGSPEAAAILSRLQTQLTHPDAIQHFAAQPQSPAAPAHLAPIQGSAPQVPPPQAAPPQQIPAPVVPQSQGQAAPGAPTGKKEKGRVKEPNGKTLVMYEDGSIEELP